MEEVDDQKLESLYLHAVRKLAQPWVHEEVSNWSLPTTRASIISFIGRGIVF